MNDLQIFNNPEFGQIRAIEKGGEPWFVAADVCQVLEIKNNRDALTRLDDDEKGVVLTDTLGGSQEMSIINEPGLYSLVLGSRKQEAKAFKRWITHEVIPSIHKHGAYMTPETIEQVLTDPDTLIKLATELKEERARRKALKAEKLALIEENKGLEAENAAQKQAIADFEPIRQYVDQILSSTGTMATTQIAADYDMSARQLNKILHEEGIQHKVNGQWVLYHEKMGKGYTKSKTIHITRSDGTPDTKLQTHWTQKGRIMIHEILTKRGIQAVMDRMSA